MIICGDALANWSTLSWESKNRKQNGAKNKHKKQMKNKTNEKQNNNKTKQNKTKQTNKQTRLVDLSQLEPVPPTFWSKILPLRHIES